MDLSIVIITFNAKKVTRRMFSSLKKSLDFASQHGDLNWEVIVVDNDSTDGVADEIESKHKDWIKMVRQDNLGFSKGNNRGVEESNPNSKYILFLNPDITLEKSTILKMHDYMLDRDDLGMVTCRVDLWTGGIDIDCHRGFPTPWRSACYFLGLEKLFALTLANFSQKVLPAFLGVKLAFALRKIFGGYHLLHEDFSQEHEIDVCLGAFMLVPRKVGEQTNWWPEDYFTNGEDVDICYQIKEIHDKKIMYVPTTKIIHFKGASKGTKKQSASVTKASTETKKKQIDSGAEAMKTFYRKYYEERYPKVLTSLVYLGIWMLHKKRRIFKAE